MAIPRKVNWVSWSHEEGFFFNFNNFLALSAASSDSRLDSADIAGPISVDFGFQLQCKKIIILTTKALPMTE